ncbi:hypothetical protein SKAU_G00122750 [Synaphobranchus kaupii]|uniref:Uncharacterized protein n=1 Tax=Synaphobranchus kaupii TaxID=118154 RepID=A0A9Q1FP39_SYNKA|nr:hypothetical protein SKAU_G00122750 [Synaphobranchus kaupii]
MRILPALQRNLSEHYSAEGHGLVPGPVMQLYRIPDARQSPYHMPHNPSLHSRYSIIRSSAGILDGLSCRRFLEKAEVFSSKNRFPPSLTPAAAQLTWMLKMTDNVVVSPEEPSVYLGKLHQLTAKRPEAPADPINVDSALASPKCGQKYCIEQAPPESSPSYYNINKMNDKFELIEQQLQNLLNKADEFQEHLVYRHDHLPKEGLALVVPTFLRTCQPYFTYLESTARSSMPQQVALPTYIRTRLLGFSQQLSSRLEQLVLTYASFNFLSLEETDPLSYFLCYEDVPEGANEGSAGREGERGPGCCVSRCWTIGQWIQTDPDPEEEDIYDWVLCSVPLGQYKHLLRLGTDEPSICIATDCLLGVLLTQEGQANSATTTLRDPP